MDIVVPEDPAIPLLGIYPEDAPTGKKDTCSTKFIAALFIIATYTFNSFYPFRETFDSPLDAPRKPLKKLYWLMTFVVPVR